MLGTDSRNLLQNWDQATNPRCRNQDSVLHFPIPLAQLQEKTTAILLEVNENVFVLHPIVYCMKTIIPKDSKTNPSYLYFIIVPNRSWSPALISLIKFSNNYKTRGFHASVSHEHLSNSTILTMGIYGRVARPSARTRNHVTPFMHFFGLLQASLCHSLQSWI